jgi:hypothetical protein
MMIIPLSEEIDSDDRGDEMAVSKRKKGGGGNEGKFGALWF